jgi:hypothetical protein
MNHDEGYMVSACLKIFGVQITGLFANIIY